MENNLFSRNSIQDDDSPYGGFDLQESNMNQNQLMHHRPRPRHNSSNLRQGTSIVHPTLRESDHSQPEKVNKSLSEDEEPSFTDDCIDGHSDTFKGKNALSGWHRVKWTDVMVRLLITAVSYINEETTSSCGQSRKRINLQKKGKWKSVSKVMSERGHLVSPQQCEDKFNDLNKRYKRLNEILGRGTSCEVVENPSLLDVMDHISDKGKDEVRKILSSKHLHYEEMCSFHNRNRLHLPHDPDLQRSLRLALLPTEEHDDNDEMEDEDVDVSEFDMFPAKRAKQCLKSSSLDSKKAVMENEVKQVSSDATRNDVLRKEWMDHRNLKLEQQKMQIKVETLELEKERLEWQRYCQKKDIELETMKMEIESMKLENEHMALELKQKEMAINDR